MSFPPVRAQVAQPYERCVFVNCPFDAAYLPLLHAMLFAIHDSGFIARTALEDTGSNEMRIEKIVRIISESCFSIHDISRVEVARARPHLPRFNMPFECGLAMGAIRYGAPRSGAPRRDFLLMAAVPFQDKQTLSDLAGQDPKVHGNDPDKIISAVRAFLSAKVRAPARTRGADAIRRRYARFQKRLPGLAKRLEISEAEVVTFDYLPDWLRIMSVWLLSQ